jgi:hypothetical protein
MKPPNAGPTVLAALLAVCPIPWIVPRTLGCGLQLLMRIVVAGEANVFPTTCRKSKLVIEIQIGQPVFCEGGGVVEGIRESNGARI